MESFLSLLRSLGSARLVAMSTVAAALIAFFAYLTVQITEPPMALLYNGLDVKDSGAIVEKLTNMGVNHKISPDGSSIMVPEDKVASLRMSMAQEGLPSGGNIGYEIFDKGDSLGTTSFVQNINRLRALEGELARSIRSIDRIQSARVHLVLPERRLFSREEREPSASIIVKSQGRMNSGQVAAIQHLAAAAVPSLEPGHISIVDERGTLLAAGAESSAEQAFVNNVDERRRAYETQLKSELEALLANSLGPGRVRAEVSAQIDFDRTTTNAEIYDPDSQVIRSTQTIEEESASSESSAGGDVSVANNLPGNQADQGGGAENASQNSRTEETINYEISKTMRTKVQEAGRIQNLSVAILVDGKRVENENGQETYQPRSEEELEKIETLVKSAIGYNEERGDTVRVVNMQFAEVEPLPMPEAPSTVFGMARSDFFRLAQLIVLAVVAALVILLVVRPLIIRILASLPPPQANKPGTPALAGATGSQTALPGAEQQALEGQNTGELTYEGAQQGGEAGIPQPMSEDSVQNAINVASIDGQVQESAVRKIGEVVQRHPDEAAAIIRNWLYNE